MMKTLIPRKSPELLVNAIGEGYAYAVNCSSPNSFRLLNQRQYEILQAVNGFDNIQVLADKFGMDSEPIERFLSLLSKTEIIGFDDGFSIPQKPAETKSLNFWIHTTNACNLGCSYCYISTLNTGKGMTELVRQQLLYKLLEAVKLKGIRHIKLRLAGGEPLGQFSVWKQFIPEARQALADAGCKFDAGFVTNLTILNDDIIAFSKEHDIGFGVSLDGVEAIHDETRSFRSGCGSFGIVNANLRKLLSQGISVSVNTVVTNLNMIGLPELTRYLIALNIPFRYSIVKGGHIDAALLEEYLSKSYPIIIYSDANLDMNGVNEYVNQEWPEHIAAYTGAFQGIRPAVMINGSFFMTYYYLLRKDPAVFVQWLNDYLKSVSNLKKCYLSKKEPIHYLQYNKSFAQHMHRKIPKADRDINLESIVADFDLEVRNFGMA